MRVTTNFRIKNKTEILDILRDKSNLKEVEDVLSREKDAVYYNVAVSIPSQISGWQLTINIDVLGIGVTIKDIRNTLNEIGYESVFKKYGGSFGRCLLL